MAASVAVLGTETFPATDNVGVSITVPAGTTFIVLGMGGSASLASAPTIDGVSLTQDVSVSKDSARYGYIYSTNDQDLCTAGSHTLVWASSSMTPGLIYCTAINLGDALQATDSSSHSQNDVIGIDTGIADASSLTVVCGSSSNGSGCVFSNASVTEVYNLSSAAVGYVLGDSSVSFGQSGTDSVIALCGATYGGALGGGFVTWWW